MAYHLREWILKSAKVSVINLLIKIDFIKEKDRENNEYVECKFNELVNKQCPNFRIIREICNGTKHFIDNNKYTQNAFLNNGSFSPGFDGTSFNSYDLIIIVEFGNRLLFKNIISNVISYWENFIKQIK